MDDLMADIFGSMKRQIWGRANAFKGFTFEPLKFCALKELKDGKWTDGCLQKVSTHFYLYDKGAEDSKKYDVISLGRSRRNEVICENSAFFTFKVRDHERNHEFEVLIRFGLTVMATATLGLHAPASTMTQGSKRKRGNEDLARSVKATNEDAFSATLLQGIDVASDDNTRTAQAALAGTLDNAYPPDSAFDATSGMTPGFGDTSQNVGDGAGQTGYGTPNQNSNKPAVGSAQWHLQRKENHKEVERRRREVINDGIETIAKIVPGTEKNKGAILSRTAQYIQELQGQVAKFETERQTLDVAIKELTKRLENSRDSIKQAYGESNKWQQRCRDAGLSFEDYDGPAPDFDGLNQADLDAIGGS